MREFIDISLQESIAERWHSVGWANLTDAEREIWCVFMLHMHLCHGGLTAAFTELGRNGLDCAVAGLTRIGAGHAASLVARAINGASETALEVEIELARSEIGEIRLELPERYAASHADEFPGPHSLVELWDSMQSRGVHEKPDRLIKFERFAEADARDTDRRCATCGQPVPEYKSKCRRCGRAYSGKTTKG